ncbi:MAG: phenylalanine--tRNA ligase subunit alpha, partial [Oscillospiraceae bacterium]|nr:phenylalanine--tRNA ligase subunit alpha [Oscillospiraceae bacterium]
MKEMLEALREASRRAIEEAQDMDALDTLRVRYLGKKGELTAILKQMGRLSAEERPVVGQLANAVRAELESELDRRKAALAARLQELKLEAETLDVTIPGRELRLGKKHVLNTVLDEVTDIFIGMGFSIAEGPEIELSEYDFDRLNIPENHTVREWTDTFYITRDEKVHLRCQTSPMQVRVMDAMKPPIRILAPGRVYRKDEVDATHSPMFHQIEGLV